MKPFGGDTAVLVSMFTESVIYGLFMLMFAVSTTLLVRRRRLYVTRKRNMQLLAVSVAMFVLATLHIAINVSRALVAFIFSNEHPIDYLASAISSPLFILKNAVYVLQTIIGDGFLIYRVYLIWNRLKMICIPLIVCFVASIGVGIGVVLSESEAGHQSGIFASSLGQWLIAFFSLTLFTDLTCTTLIAARIWWIHKHTRAIVNGPSLLPAIVIIVESGAVYSFCVAILLGLYISHSYAHKILLDAVTQLIGVVFSAIIIRVCLGISTENDQDTVRIDTLFLTTPPSPSTSKDFEIREPGPSSDIALRAYIPPRSPIPIAPDDRSERDAESFMAK